ncbi:MAG: Hpt domain-containing protein, partial [Treponema sp.]|nr:Hpt domain-containing protein [Treponema sp.]
MAIDKSKYISKFAEEGLENISIVETLLFEIKEGSSTQDDIVTLMRALHTLKGSARMLEFKNIEALSHILETVFISLKEEKIIINDKAVRLLLAGLDKLKEGISLIKTGEQDGKESALLQKELTALSMNEDFTIPEAAEVSPHAGPSGSIQADEEPEIGATGGVPVVSETVKDEPAVFTLAGRPVDKSKYIAKFSEEGLENISTVEKLLFEIKDGASVQDDLVTLMRALHTLKGSARMLEFNSLESLSHALETVFISLKEERISLNDKAVRLLLAGLEELTTGINKIKSGGKDDIRAEIFLKELSALSANEDYNVPEPGHAQAAGGVSVKTKAAEKIQDEAAGSKRNKLEEAKSESIRIPLERINEIIHNMAALQSLEIAARNIARDTE